VCVQLEEMRRRVAEERVARLATIDPAGRPHIVPICFALADDTLYSAVDEKPKRSRQLQRLTNIRAHPRVAILIDYYEEDWSRLWWIRLRGEARLIENGRQLKAALQLLTAKYQQYRSGPPSGPLLAVQIDDWRAWSAEPGASF
jgi:PPOX class probable F420-dependent enzyme